MRIRTSLLALFALFGAVVMAAPPTGKITLAWDYPTNELSTNITFKIYWTTVVSTPLSNWAVIAHVPGTNLSHSVTVAPGINFFSMTASNLWGESPFSNVASTPTLPGDVKVRISKVE